jgi:hypothetical protein
VASMTPSPAHHGWLSRSLSHSQRPACDSGPLPPGGFVFSADFTAYHPQQLDSNRREVIEFRESDAVPPLPDARLGHHADHRDAARLRFGPERQSAWKAISGRHRPSPVPEASSTSGYQGLHPGDGRLTPAGSGEAPSAGLYAPASRRPKGATCNRTRTPRGLRTLSPFAPGARPSEVRIAADMARSARPHSPAEAGDAAR